MLGLGLGEVGWRVRDWKLEIKKLGSVLGRADPGGNPTKPHDTQWRPGVGGKSGVEVCGGGLVVGA